MHLRHQELTLFQRLYVVQADDSRARRLRARRKHGCIRSRRLHRSFGRSAPHDGLETVREESLIRARCPRTRVASIRTVSLIRSVFSQSPALSAPHLEDGSIPLGHHKYWVLVLSGYSISIIRMLGLGLSAAP